MRLFMAFRAETDLILDIVGTAFGTRDNVMKIADIILTHQAFSVLLHPERCLHIVKPF